MTFNESLVGQYIYTMLNDNITGKVYYNRASRDSAFPLVVFNVLDAFQQEGSKSTFMLEINIWDNKGNNITDLLSRQKELQDFLHKRSCENSNFSLWFNLESTLQIPNVNADQEQERRRQLRFSCIYYSKEE